jgi:hypothetical protein
MILFSRSSSILPHLPDLRSNAIQIWIDNRLGDPAVPKFLPQLGTRPIGYYDPPDGGIWSLPFIGKTIRVGPKSNEPASLGSDAAGEPRKVQDYRRLR